MARRTKEKEIVKILNEAEAVGNIRDVIRKYNMSENDYTHRSG